MALCQSRFRHQLKEAPLRGQAMVFDPDLIWPGWIVYTAYSHSSHRMLLVTHAMSTVCVHADTAWIV